MIESVAWGSIKFCRMTPIAVRRLTGWYDVSETGLPFWLQCEIDQLPPSYIRDTTVTLEPGEITPPTQRRHRT